MRRLFVVLLLVLVMPALLWAAGASVTQTINPIKTRTGDVVGIEYTLTCTGDSVTGAISDTDFTSGLQDEIEGMYLYRMIVTNTTTQADVTDDSDIYIKTDLGNDLLNGDGVDRLDKDAENYVRLTYREIITDDMGTLYLDVDGNSGASSVYTITLVFVL